MNRLLITNARLINEGETRDADVLIDGERISKIASSITPEEGVEVIDAAGRLLMPGMIDDQVHFREPGLTNKGDLATESAAAVAGGITSFMDMPNVNPQTTTRQALADKYAIAEHRCTANYGFYLGGTNRNIEEIKSLEVGEACGIKVFMGASTGDMLVDDPAALERIFQHAPVMVVTHCEHSPTIWDNEAKARAEYGDSVPMSEHPNIRSAAACLKSSGFAVDMARRFDALLHVLHLTTAVEMALFSKAHRSDKRITAEVCVHHLWFDESRYEDLGTRIKCNPAIKAASDREALVRQMRHGYGRPLGQMATHNVLGYDPDLEPPERDLEESRRLLREAGHGEGLELVLELRASRRADPLVRQLAEAGINVTLQPQPWGVVWPRLRADEVDFYLGGIVAFSADASDVLDSMMHSKDAPRGYGALNHNGYADPQLDQLIEAAASTRDMHERSQLLRRCMRVGMEHLQLIPLYEPFELYGASSRVTWKPRLDGRLVFSEIAPDRTTR